MLDQNEAWESHSLLWRVQQENWGVQLMRGRRNTWELEDVDQVLEHLMWVRLGLKGWAVLSTWELKWTPKTIFLRRSVEGLLLPVDATLAWQDISETD